MDKKDEVLKCDGCYITLHRVSRWQPGGKCSECGAGTLQLWDGVVRTVEEDIAERLEKAKEKAMDKIELLQEGSPTVMNAVDAAKNRMPDTEDKITVTAEFYGGEGGSDCLTFKGSREMRGNPEDLPLMVNSLRMEANEKNWVVLIHNPLSEHKFGYFSSLYTPAKEAEACVREEVPLIRAGWKCPETAQGNPTPPSSRQVGGSHYKDMGIQPWELMEANGLPGEFVGYLKWNAVNYLLRVGRKGVGTEDVEKAIHYAEKLIEVLKEGELECLASGLFNFFDALDQIEAGKKVRRLAWEDGVCMGPEELLSMRQKGIRLSDRFSLDDIDALDWCVFEDKE